MDSLHSSLLQALLPPVSYDPNADNVVAACTVDGLALDRAYGRGDIPLLALRPFEYDGWFTAYENTYALPGPCFGGDLTRDERVVQLAVALRERRGVSREYYHWLAGVCGYDITIEEHAPFVAGSCAGASLYNGDWRYVWIIRVDAVPRKPFRAGRNTAGDPLQAWGDPLLECLFRLHAPAHTAVHFAYGIGD